MKAQDRAAAKFENFDLHAADAATRTPVWRKLLHLKRVKVTQRAHEGTQDAGSHCTRRANNLSAQLRTACTDIAESPLAAGQLEV